MKPAALALSLALSAGIACFALRASGAHPHPVAPPATHSTYIPGEDAQLVAFHQKRVENDPGGAIGWAMLAEAQLAKSSAHDDNHAAIEAETAARKSLAIRSYGNTRAQALVVRALLAQHRFSDALDEATRDAAANPEDSTLNRLKLEILLELGRYDEFKAQSDRLMRSTDPAGMAVRARWALLTGKNEQAIGLLRQVCAELDSTPAIPGPTVSWFYVQLAKALDQSGRTDEALQALKQATYLNAGDFQAFALGAAILVRSGRRQEARTWAQRSVELTPTVSAASVLEDTSRADDEKQAAQLMVERCAHPDLSRFLTDPSSAPVAKPHTHDRLYATYLAEHRRNLDDALLAAQQDLAARHDIYAYDTLALVLHAMGRDAEAKGAMAQATRLGTVDRLLADHLKVISPEAK